MSETLKALQDLAAALETPAPSLHEVLTGAAARLKSLTAELAAAPEDQRAELLKRMQEEVRGLDKALGDFDQLVERARLEQAFSDVLDKPSPFRDEAKDAALKRSALPRRWTQTKRGHVFWVGGVKAAYLVRTGARTYSLYDATDGRRGNLLMKGLRGLKNAKGHAVVAGVGVLGSVRP